MICPECGTANDVGASVCLQCGRALGGAGISPPSKGLAIASLALGIVSLPTLGCLGLGALLALVLGIIALLRARREPQRYAGAGIAIGGIVCAILSLALAIPLAIASAIAIPALLRSRMQANESAVIGDVRTVIAAEHTYAASNEGYYDTLECLARPAACNPALGDVPMIDSSLAFEPVKNGYRRTFHPGPSAVAADPSSTSPTSMSSFAYVAVPVKSGNTGQRAFCGDASGIICSTSDGSIPLVVDGACDLATCSPMM